MYVRRRRPDTLEIQQMKEQKKEEAKQKARERDALKREIRVRIWKNEYQTLAIFTKSLNRFKMNNVRSLQFAQKNMKMIAGISRNIKHVFQALDSILTIFYLNPF